MSESCEGKAAAWPAELARLLSWWKLVSGLPSHTGAATPRTHGRRRRAGRGRAEGMFPRGEGAGRYGYGGAIDDPTRGSLACKTPATSTTPGRPCTRRPRSENVCHGWRGGRDEPPRLAAAGPLRAARRRTLELCNAERGLPLRVHLGSHSQYKAGRRVLQVVKKASSCTQDNHSSVVGVREYALEAGATASPVV